MYLGTGDPGLSGGGTYTGSNTQPTLEQYENIFGPAARDIKLDQQRHKRHQRWHLPDALKGSNQYLTDRVDGLITDATNSPFTRNILPYVYLENPDQKLKWNVYSFDEGIASRVPYESAARVLPQTKRSFAGYTVRQGLAIAMEHNFMVSAAGRENFKNQLTQLVGSIQMTNDLDVHVALLSAPSHQKHMNEKYYDTTKTTAQTCRQYVDLFGIMQKVPNALDILIEDAKNHLKTWGSAPPTFLLCNGALTAQMTMLPEKTNYLTNGPDGAARLAQGPDLPSYRGLSIVHSRKFSMDAGTAPRDLLRRRVRVAEYYRIPWTPQNKNRMYEFYDQSRDTMFRLSWDDLCRKADISGGGLEGNDDDDDDLPYIEPQNYWRHVGGRQKPINWNWENGVAATPTAFLKVHSNSVAAGAVDTEYTDSTGAIQALFAALGVSPDVFYKKSALLWPRTIEPIRNNGEPIMRKKYDVDELVDTTCVPEERKTLKNCTMTNAEVENQMQDSDPGKFKHHKMSEINPVINDHVVNSLKETLNAIFTGGAANWLQQPTLMANFDSLKKEELYTSPATAANFDHYGHNTELAHCFTRSEAFFTNYDAQPFKHFEDHIISNKFQLYQCEVGTAVNALRDVLQEQNVAMNAELAPANPAAIGTDRDTRRLWIANNGTSFVAGGGATAPAHPCADINASVKALWSSIFDARAPVDINVAGGTDRYLDYLLAWRKEYWKSVFRDIPDIRQCNVDAGPDEVPDNVKSKHRLHTNQLPKVKNMLMTFAIEEEVNIAGAGTVDDATLVTNDMKDKFNGANDSTNPMAAAIAYNIFNKRKRGQGIYAPNLHINRCTPLRQQDEKLSASSMEPWTWLLQQVVGMMPLSKKMCKVLTSSPPFLNTLENKAIINEYAKFWHGNTNAIGTGDGTLATPFANAAQEEQASHFNTFLMHWYMSEFHPLGHIREAAKGVLGLNMDRHGVSHLLSCLADCLNNNTTMHNMKEMDKAFGNMKPSLFNQNEIMVSTAVAEKECAYVVPFCTSEKDPIFHRVDWKNMPVATNYEDVKCYIPKMNAQHDFDVAAAEWNEVAEDIPKFYDAFTGQVMDMSNDARYKHSEHYNAWMRKIPGFCDRMSHLRYHADIGNSNLETAVQNIYDTNERYEFEQWAKHMANDCMSEDPRMQDNILRHIVMVLANRFWKPTTRAMNNGQGLAVYKSDEGKPGYYFSGSHLMHGPHVPVIDHNADGGGVPQDLLILRPNIEHEMLGIIMGRGGTQELGATFWGQTELSCYDDAQHGIWGMSYKYHQRAMVTNERNLIRVYDVAFDGYNGGMDQRHVNWNDPQKRQEFREATFDRTRAYNGPSMLVMALPHDMDRSPRAWPNPIIFTPEVSGNPSPSPDKEQPPSDVNQHIVFNCKNNDYYCSEPQAAKYRHYMQRLDMEHWMTVDQANRPAGDCCVGNETSSQMFAFEGTMKVLDKHSGAVIDVTQGSGHLGPSYVGVASIREGRGIQNAHMQPSLHRLI